MYCKYYCRRSKKGKKYCYCRLLKKEISFSDCKSCTKKEYKQIKPIKKRTYSLSKREKERFSIIYSDLTKCCVCGSKIEIEKNEVFEGACRQTSIKYGMVNPLCREHHKEFHKDRFVNLFFKTMFENEFLKTHTKEEFIKLFGKDYIYLFEVLKKAQKNR